jgi:hypothetical protein
MSPGMWCRACIALLAVWPWPGLLRADDDDPPEAPRIPKVGCPESDFYNAIGTGVRLTAVASPTEVTTRDWIEYKLTIVNLVNAGDIEKPSLKSLADFRYFQIDESPELDPKIDSAVKDRRVFRYRLRPASENVTLIPEVPFYYFDPKRVVADDRPRDRFPKTFSNAIAIKVTAPVQHEETETTPLTVPPFATELASRERLLSDSSQRWSGWVWPVALVVPPILVVAWVCVWLRLNPDSARLAQLRRHRAVRIALSALSAVRRHPGDDPAGSITRAWLTYLHERFDLPSFARTPREVAAHLCHLNVPAERIEAATAFGRACDAARFSPAQAVATELAAETERLIAMMEEPA